MSTAQTRVEGHERGDWSPCLVLGAWRSCHAPRSSDWGQQSPSLEGPKGQGSRYSKCQLPDNHL